MIKKFLPVLILTLAVGPASAAIVVSEDFEGYANTAAMQANWGRPERERWPPRLETVANQRLILWHGQ
ncbi:MAG: hypothetical protein R3C56_13145 [Pirellulaceae bacterium]